MRVPMITRTIKTTVASVMTVNTTDGSTEVKHYELPRTYKDNKAVLRALADKNTDTVKLVHVVSTAVNEQLYGMSEPDFLKYAQPIEKRAKSEDTTGGEE